jgi:hypothetical protein
MLRLSALLSLVLVLQSAPQSCTSPAHLDPAGIVRSQTDENETPLGDQGDASAAEPSGESPAGTQPPVQRITPTDVEDVGDVPAGEDDTDDGVGAGGAPGRAEFGWIVGRVRGQRPDGDEPVPLAGAVVKLFREGALLRETQTDDEGKYAFRKLEPGGYGVAAFAEGYVPADARVKVAAGEETRKDFVLRKRPAHGVIVGHVMTMGDNGEKVPIAGALVQLRRDGQVLRETHTNPGGHYRFGDVRPGDYGMLASAEGFMPEDARVHVTPGHEVVQNFLLEHRGGFGRIAGRVLEPADDGTEVPLPGALVKLRQGDHILRETRSNDRGLYQFGEVPAGVYGVIAMAEHHVPADASVEVHAGQTTEQNFLLRRAPRPGAIAGRVLGETDDGGEMPVHNALVKVMRNGHVVRETRTGENGHYEFAELLPGVYGMVALAESYMAQDARVEVVGGQVAEHDFVLPQRPPPGGIAGRVEGLQGDGSVIPLPGALLKLFKNGNVIREVRTNEHGEYRIPEVPAGEFGLLARAEGYLPEDAHVIVRPGEITEQNFVLEPQ